MSSQKKYKDNASSKELRPDFHVNYKAELIFLYQQLQWEYYFVYINLQVFQFAYYLINSDLYKR